MLKKNRKYRVNVEYNFKSLLFHKLEIYVNRRF